jgi:hypothetical protein
MHMDPADPDPQHWVARLTFSLIFYIYRIFLRSERGKAGRGRFGTGSRQTGARQTARQQTPAEVHEQGSEPDGKWD